MLVFALTYLILPTHPPFSRGGINHHSQRKAFGLLIPPTGCMKPAEPLKDIGSEDFLVSRRCSAAERPGTETPGYFQVPSIPSTSAGCRGRDP